MVVDALQKVGAARSIVIDEHGVILAGNGVTEAAAEAGITKVRVIDASGDELIAVRRTGLTDEQKVALAIYDNRGAELAEWNIEQLVQDQANGINLTPYFFEQELKTLLGDVDGVDAPGLPSGGKGDFEQMTFTLHLDQAISVRLAVDTAKDAGRGTSALNENSNGNALAAICEAYRG